MQDSNLSKTPAEKNPKLMKATEVEQIVDETIYGSLVGCFLLIAKQTRPDLVWIVNVLSRSSANQRTSTGWLANVYSAIYKPQSHSYSTRVPRRQ